MQTPSVLPTFNATPAPAPTRQADTSAPDQQFNQMLTRQMNERDAVKAPTRQPDVIKSGVAKNDSADAGNAARSTSSNAAVAPKADPAAAPAAPPPSNTSAAAGKADGKDKSSAAKSGKNDADPSIATAGTDATLAASAAIMALVANAAQADARPAPATLNASNANAADPSRALTGDRLSGARSEGKLLPDATLAELGGKGDAAGTHETGSAEAGTLFDRVLKTAGGRDGEGAANLIPLSAVIGGENNAVQSIVPPWQANPVELAPLPGIHPGNTLAPPVGTDAWDQTLGQRVVWMAAGAEQSASLTLNPPDLGPMQVVLHVSNGQADASFFSAQPEVRQALEAAMPKLREMLGQAGVSLGQTSVSAGNPGSGGDARPGARGNQGGTGANEAVISSSGVRGFSSGNGLVDTFA